MDRRKRADCLIVATHLLLFVSVFAWTQTRSITPVQLKKKTPAVTFLRFSGTSEATKLSRSRMPSPPPALTRSERISAIALARKTGNIQTKSLADEPRPTIVLTPGAPVSGQNKFEVYLGCLYSIGPVGGPLLCATLSSEAESCFYFKLNVVPGKTYLADFKVSWETQPWIISGDGIEAEIASENGHLLVGFRAEHEHQGIMLRQPNNASGISALYGPAFFRLELTKID